MGILIGIFFNTIVYQVLPLSNSAINSYTYEFNQNLLNPENTKTLSDTFEQAINLNNYKNIDLTLNNELSFVTSQIWDGALAETSHITTLGNVLYTVYPIWLIITSIILLLAMVGAIVITIKQKN